MGQARLRLSRRGSLRKRPGVVIPPTGALWPEGGDPAEPNASSLPGYEGTIQSLVNDTARFPSAPVGSAPTVIPIPDGVYRELVTIGRRGIRLKPKNDFKVEIRAADKFTNWEPIPAVNPTKWRSVNTIPNLLTESRWQYWEITDVVGNYNTPGMATSDPNYHPTTIGVASTALLSVGQMVNIGFGDDQSSLDLYELRMITDKSASTITLDQPLLGYHQGTAAAAQERSAVAFAVGSYPEQVYRDGPDELGGTTLRKVTDPDPDPNDFFVDTSGRVVVGTNPASHVMEVTVRNYCISMTAAADDVTIDGLCLIYGGNKGIAMGGDPLRPTVTRCEMAWCHTVGTSTNGTTDPVIHQNHFHHCGLQGIAHSNTSVFTFTNNEVDHCNTKLFKTNWGACAVKINGTRYAVIRDNHIHHNYGNGLWFDLGTNTVQNIEITGGRFHHNNKQAIRLEDYHECVVDGVVCWENGRGDPRPNVPDPTSECNIQFDGSHTCTIQNSILAWGWDGGVQLATQPNRPERNNMHDHHVNNCTIIQHDHGDGSPEALKWDDQDWQVQNPFLAPANNNGNNNTYAFTNASGQIVPESATGTTPVRFRWNNTNYHRLGAANGSTAGSFNATIGEQGSVLITSQSQLTQILTDAGINLDPE